jgi:hypothetical protein
MTQMQANKEDLEKMKKEQAIKEKQMQEKIAFLEKVSKHHINHTVNGPLH